MNPLRDSFELVLHYERGYWVSEDAVPALYLESVDWAQQIWSERGQEQLQSA